MKIKGSAILFHIVIVLSIGCTENKTINIKRYICPELNGEGKVLYQYSNSNLKLFPLKYLLITKESTVDERYTYSFLDTSLNLMNAITEVRLIEYSNIKNMITIELDENNLPIQNDISIDAFQIPYVLKIGNEINATWQWPSKIHQNTTYHQSMVRKLISKNDHFPLQDSTVSIIEFSSKESLKSSDEVNPIVSSIEFSSVLVYADKLGLIQIDMTFSNGQKSQIVLNQILKGAQLEDMLNAKN